MNKIEILRNAAKLAPTVRPLLSNKARFMLYTPEAYKTYDYMQKVIEGLVSGVYNNLVGGQFVDSMANLISGQLTQAYQQAYIDEGFTSFTLPDYLASSLETMILNQYDFVDAFFRDIVDARIDGTPIDPLLARAQLWAGQYDTAYQNAVALITKEMGGNLIWQEGDTIEKCYQCVSFDGIVARASEWAALGIAPKNFPNDKLDCKGGHCDCTLTPTTKRRSPNAYGRLEAILLGI
jgi:hypothetical protein